MPGPVTRILVGYDGSPSSARAVQFAMTMAGALSGRLWLVHAHERGRAIVEPVTEEEAGAPVRAVTRSMDAFVEQARARGLEAVSVVREGHPAEVLTKMAAELGVGALVLGTRGLGGASRLLLGSVSARMAGQATVPVVIVP